MRARRSLLAAVIATLPLLHGCGGGADTEVADPGNAGPLGPPGEAAFLTLLGDDTLAVEWMRVRNGTVEAEALIRGSRTLFGVYRLTFGEDGTVVAYRADTHAGADADAPLVRSERLERDGAGPELVVTRDGEERRDPVELESGAVPFVDMLHWPFEASLRWQMEARAALEGYVPVFSARGISRFDLVANDDGTWQLVHPSRGPSTMEVDEEGRIRWLDGTGSTRAYDLRRVEHGAVDPAALAATFADRPMGELSGRGEIDATVAGVHFTGHYGEPLKRGREIFGALLSYGDWWRTGANQATHISFDRGLVIDGEVIPAGDYTLSSIPEEEGGTLIINRQTGQGGQSYDPSMDQARVEMRRDRLDEVVEAFEIRAVETEEGGRLELRWDDTVYWVPFTTR
jgi:hypothetical protein